MDETSLVDLLKDKVVSYSDFEKAIEILKNEPRFSKYESKIKYNVLGSYLNVRLIRKKLIGQEEVINIESPSVFNAKGWNEHVNYKDPFVEALMEKINLEYKS
ncbi:MAG: hypothetical protein AABW92_02420 [Nanoarchaeota archaeon]